MKRFKFLVLLFFSMLFLSSCQNDDDGYVNRNELIGTWYLIDETVDGVPVFLNCESVLDFTPYRVSNINYFGLSCSFVDVFVNDYYVDGNEIVNTGPFETYVDEILVLNNSRLVLSRFDEYYENGQFYYLEVISTYIR